MQQLDINQLGTSPAKLIGQQWMLITAGKEGRCGADFNMMTASWGGIGYVWNKPVACVLIRPNRHTHPFVESAGTLTLSFMPEQYRQDLVYCGRHSGKDVDKCAETPLRPYTTPGGLIAMQDADLVLECRVMYRTRMQQADFRDWSDVSPRFYDEGEENPLHDLYICEITAAWQR